MENGDQQTAMNLFNSFRDNEDKYVAMDNWKNGDFSDKTANSMRSWEWKGEVANNASTRM
jgi:hypothetical protein